MLLSCKLLFLQGQLLNFPSCASRARGLNFFLFGRFFGFMEYLLPRMCYTSAPLKLTLGRTRKLVPHRATRGGGLMEPPSPLGFRCVTSFQKAFTIHPRAYKGLAYGNCARGTSGSQNCGVLSVFCELHDALGSRFRLRFRMLQLKTPVFCSL